MRVLMLIVANFTRRIAAACLEDASMVNSELRAEADENSLGSHQAVSAGVRALIRQGKAVLGIELGSTRIKACLIGPDSAPIAAGGAEWENELVAGMWTYSLDAVWSGLRDCVADLLADVKRRYQVRRVPARCFPAGFFAMIAAQRDRRPALECSHQSPGPLCEQRRSALRVRWPPCIHEREEDRPVPFEAADHRVRFTARRGLARNGASRLGRRRGS
jgi:hypothetical protein